MNGHATRPEVADIPAENSGLSLRQRAELAMSDGAFRLPTPVGAMSPEAMQQKLHELQVHQIELEMQNHELRRSQAALNTSQARYFDFYDMAPVGYCTVDGSGQILQANLTAATLLGVGRDVMLQQAIGAFILPDDQDIYYLMRQRIIGTGAPQSCELRMTTQQGRTFWAHLDALGLPHESGVPGLRMVLTNIDEHKLAEKALVVANKKLLFENEEKEKRAAELLVANQKLLFENEEKEKRAAELLVANRKLLFENEEKEKRASELLIANEKIKNFSAELEVAFLSILEVVMVLTEMRDPYTAGHERRVAEIAAAIGVELGLDAQQQQGLSVAALLHDVGKVSIPAEFLVKPGQLSSIEYRMVQRHSQAGHDILKNVQFPLHIAEVVLQHHERMDGSGYPQGLAGEAILLNARIIAVADVVEAMSSHRPYRVAFTIDAALAEIERGRGTLFDAQVVDACLRLFRQKGFSISAK